ncbi:MAG: redoxin domain-containing protein [Deltaproteobacteria bacterium]|nr:redoxin domain-containing protein [Candidatus Desulfobacula maris]MBL6993340.1 redoxin domain-containing protein [Desulfobacula sp.]
MKRFPKVLTAILMIAIFTIIPLSKTLAAKDPFLDVGFIQAREQIPALNFTLEDLDGKQVQFTDFRGKVVLLFFWTTW